MGNTATNTATKSTKSKATKASAKPAKADAPKADAPKGKALVAGKIARGTKAAPKGKGALAAKPAKKAKAANGEARIPQYRSGVLGAKLQDMVPKATAALKKGGTVDSLRDALGICRKSVRALIVNLKAKKLDDGSFKL